VGPTARNQPQDLDDVGPADVNWSEDLEEFHEESTRDHPLEVLTRRTAISLLDALGPTASIVEVGCSTGYLLEDLQARYPSARLVGFDLIASGLRKAHLALPDCLVARADACELPLADGVADAVLSVNLLEHVYDDRRALAEIMRVLRPGAAAVLIVPTGPGLCTTITTASSIMNVAIAGERWRTRRAAPA